jgi:cell division protein FtsB
LTTLVRSASPITNQQSPTELRAKLAALKARRIMLEREIELQNDQDVEVEQYDRMAEKNEQNENEPDALGKFLII